MTLRLFATLLGVLPAALAVAGEPPLDPQPGDHICLIGNELGERMQHHDFFETLLHQQFPDRELVVRNLCFPGDEVTTRIRSKNFGTPDAHLEHSGADVVLMFFGFNESFAGQAGLAGFKRDLAATIAAMQEQTYNGESAPRLVLISPTAYVVDPSNEHLPRGEAENDRLRLYADAMAEVAEQTGIGYVDLLEPTESLLAENSTVLDTSDPATGEAFTLDGVHLTENGYRALAPILLKRLCGESPTIDELDETLRAEVADKNFHWWHRYRAVNGFSIYGDRGLAGKDGSGTYNNRDVMERERAILDEMAAIRDGRIHAVAAGREVAAAPDDSGTMPFLSVQTNVGGEDDPNRKRGKLGSLEYLTAEQQLEQFVLPEGYEISLVASEEDFPELANPVAIAFDAQGRPWVSTMPSYPHWQPKSPLDDKLLILNDTDGDNRTDTVTVFADGLHQPTGFEIAGDGVYVAQQPDVLFLQDTNGDDREDRRIRRLVGFDSADSHHGLAAFTFGPGGQLYFNEGTFKYSQVESPYGLTRLEESGVWRFHSRSSRFGAHVSFAFANPWGHSFDRWGQDFIADASPGQNYWAAPISGHIDWPMKHAGGSHHKRVGKQGGGDLSYRHPTFLKKRTRPSAGCELVSSRHFPEEDQGDYLLTNVIGDRSVLRHSVREDGVGFVAEEKEPLVYGKDGNFRPVDLEFAPDGSLYIVDWHNALIGHLQHNLRDPSRDHSHGRIWRITAKGRPLVEPPQVAGASVGQLLENLALYEDRARYRSRQQLAVQPTDEVMTALDEWVAGLDESADDFEHHRLEALWVAQTHDVVRPDLLDAVLASPDHRARAAAVRVLSFWVDRVDSPYERLAAAIADEHPRVRLEALRALSFCEGDEAIETALGALEYDLDPLTQYTLDETMRQLDQ